MLHYQYFPYILKVTRIELISCHHNDFLAGNFEIDKTYELITKKYYWLSLHGDVEAYIKGCDICLTFKTIRHKFYDNLQYLPVPTHYLKDLLIDFVTGLSISTNWKSDSYDSILVIVNHLTKMIHYELVKIIINTLGLVEVILNIVVQHYRLPDSIITDIGSLFTLKF